MDQLLLAYIDCHYTDEIRDSLYNSLNLLIIYDYPDFQSSLIDHALRDQHEHKETIEDNIYNDIRDKVKDTVNQQGIYLKEDASLEVYIEISKALLLIQKLDDYTSIDLCLNSIAFEEEKVVYILTEYSSLTEVEVLDNYISCDHMFIKTLKDLVDTKMGYELEPYSELQKEALNKIRLFSKLYENALGVQLVRDGVIPGQRIELYMAYLKDYIETLSNEELAIHFYSIILMSSSCKENPVDVYRAEFQYIVDDLQKQMYVERQLSAVVSKFSEIVKEDDAKNRLP